MAYPGDRATFASREYPVGSFGTRRWCVNGRDRDHFDRNPGFELASDQAFTHANKDPLDGPVFRSNEPTTITERDYRQLFADVRHRARRRKSFNLAGWSRSSAPL